MIPLRTVACFLLVAACGTEVVVTRPDDVVVSTASADASAPEVCTAANTGPSCVPLPSSPCDDGGHRFGCYGSTCAVADAGACVVVLEKTAARYTETCCERPACTRMSFYDKQQCAARDAGREEGWVCPQGLTPPGDCTPDSPVTGATVEFCCR
jgi:hypothetical protein